MQVYPFEKKIYKSRNVSLFYRHLPNPGKPALLGLHGYNDTSETFQFLLPYLAPHFELYFPDWRGHGESPRLTDGYYGSSTMFGDLAQFTYDVLPRRYTVLGHSMGASFGARFAGVFPEEVEALVLFEGFSGLIPLAEEKRRLRSWMDSLRKDSNKEKKPPRKMRRFEVMGLLKRMHSRLTDERIEFLAGYLAKEEEGGFFWHYDPDFRDKFAPVPFPPELSRELWQSITCPVLVIFGEQTHLKPGSAMSQEEMDKMAATSSAALTSNPALAEVLGHFKNIEFHEIAGAGHNVHHDCPETVIEIMDKYFNKNNILK